MVCKNANTTRKRSPTVTAGGVTGPATAAGVPANATTVDGPAVMSRSKTPASTSAGTASTQPTWTARNAVRPTRSRRDHSQRNTSGTTLCRWASTTKWYAGQDSEAVRATPSPASPASRDTTARPACSTPKPIRPSTVVASGARSATTSATAAQPANAGASATRRVSGAAATVIVVLLSWLAALALTLAVEVPLYASVLRLAWGIRLRDAAGLGAAVNALTHPVLWWSLAPWTGRPWYPWLVAGAEVVVCAVEWLALAVLVRRDRLALAALSLGANAASVLAGIIAAYVTGAPGR